MYATQKRVNSTEKLGGLEHGAIRSEVRQGMTVTNKGTDEWTRCFPKNLECLFVVPELEKVAIVFTRLGVVASDNRVQHASLLPHDKTRTHCTQQSPPGSGRCRVSKTEDTAGYVNTSIVPGGA